ncbi:MAG: NADH-quinone oxidoreductase subunit N [Candidatus Odinarchaeota archaeon]|nr:NADH-quinone oxidoreductase subunit N [Candidatus Odinarchaeota archaeon]
MIAILNVALPELEIALGLIGFTVLFIILFDILEPKKQRIAGVIASVVLLVGLFLTVERLTSIFYGTFTTETVSLLVFDAYSYFFATVFLFVSFLVTLLSLKFMKEFERQGLYYALLLLSTIGMTIVASTLDLIILVVGWELASMSAYGLVAIRRDEAISIEAALKYFITSVIGSGIALFGISLLFGLTGSVNLQQIYLVTSNLSGTDMILGYFAVALIISGFGFKMAIVPFHAWIPDTYSGAPTPVTTFLAAASKKMGFAAVLRILIVALMPFYDFWSLLFAVFAIITMTYGNLVALTQKTMKRLMAYSSISHAGYILIGITAIVSVSAQAGILLHIVMHALMKIVAFGAIMVVTYQLNTDKIDDYAGLRKKAPITSFLLTITLFSLMGVPPLGGFLSKYLLFLGAVEAGWAWLAILGVINSVISVFYYFNIIKKMYVDEPSEAVMASNRKEPLSYVVVLLIATILIVAFGVYPDPWIVLAEKVFVLP